jgi:hypothetical protein
MRKFYPWFLALLGLVVFMDAMAMAQSKALIVHSVDETSQVTLSGNTHPLAQARYDRGAIADETSMGRMLLVLRRSAATQKVLKARLEAMQTRGSKLYHKWLTPAEFGSLYGANSADLSIVTQWLGSHGFQGIQVSPNRSVIEFSGSAGQVRSAFHTEMHLYNVQGSEYVANASNPSIPGALAPLVAGFASLNNFSRKPMHETSGMVVYDKTTHSWHKKTDAVLTAQAQVKKSPTFTTDSGSLFLVAPGDFATIYNLTPLWNAGIDGTGESIAIVARSNINTADVDAFRASFGLPATKLKVLVNGDDPGLASDEAEADLDVQWAGAVAKNATIDLVVSKSTDTTDGVDLSSLYAVENNVAPILSVSFGSCELALGPSGNLFYEQLWQQATAQGMTVSVASGDGGSGDCDQGDEVASNGLEVNGLASTAYNVAVGGTDFDDWGGPNGVSTGSYWNSTNDSSTLSSAKSYIPEMAWNSSCAGYLFVEAEGFSDGGTSCNSDLAYIDSFINTVAGGGGKSQCTTTDSSSGSCAGGYAKPSWQSVAGVASDGKRDLPDLSLFAGNGLAGSYLVYCQSDASPDGTCDYTSSTDIGYLGGGGTSYATPAFAGIMALVDQKLAARQGNANYALYSMARGQFGTAASPNATKLAACSSEKGSAVDTSCIFQDVVTGTNTVPCTSGSSDCSADDTYGILTGYSAGTGFDMATGLGSVNAANLVNAWSTSATTTATATNFTITPVSSNYGTALSFTATVAASSGSGTPTGSVILIANSTNVGSFALSNGTVSGTLTGLTAGTYPIYASYLGDDTYGVSSSTAMSVTVAQAASSTALSVQDQDPYTGATTSAGTVHYGFTATASATVSGASSTSVPTGTVTFTKGTVTASSALSAAGTATYSSTGDVVGTVLAYTAAYSGDTNYKASSSATQSVTVVKADTYLRITPSTSYLVGSGNVTLTVTDYSHSRGSNPTGSLYLTVNGSSYSELAGTGVTDSITGGAAITAQFVLPASALSAGSNTLGAVYGGDANYNGSQASMTFGYSSSAPSASVTLTGTPASITAGATVPLQAQVMIGSVPATTGIVTFYDGSKLLGTVPVVSTPASSAIAVGSASITARPPAGSHSYTAVFGGNSTVPGTVTSAALSIQSAESGALVSSTTLAAAANSTNALNTDFTADVIGQGFRAPSGTVDVKETSIVNDLGSLTLDATTAAPSVRATKIFSLGDTVQFVASGDLNQDGFPDFILRVGNSPSSLYVYLGNGDGTFKDPVVYPVGSASRGHGIDIQDVNGDGIPDVVTANQTSNTVSILLGVGDGTLRPAYSLSTGSYQPGTVRVIDLNKDGIPDIFVGDTANGAQVFLGNGDGTFQTMKTASLSSLAYQEELGDFNGDGIPDLVYDSIIDPTLRVQLGNGDGTFDSANEKTYTITSDAAPYPAAIHAYDVNKDGKLDLVIPDSYSSNVVIMLGNGDGTFGTSVSYLGGTNVPVVRDVAFGDFNNDGKIDLAVVDSVNANVSLLLGNGDGTFNAPQGFFATLSFPSQIVAVDADGDGYPDLFQTSQLNGDDQAVLLMGGTGTTGTLSNVSVYGSTSVTQSGTGTYAGDTYHAGSVSATASFTGSGKLMTPTIVWNPASLTWGVEEPLGTAILDAGTQNNVAGTLTYQAQLSDGTVYLVNSASALPSTGAYTLTANFVPTDPAQYTTATASISLTVTATSFLLTAPSDSISLANGSTATANLTVAAVNGFSAAVGFSCSTDAPGIACSFSPAVLNGSGTSTVTLSATAATGSAATASNLAHTTRAEAMALAGLLAFGFLFPVVRRSRVLYSFLLLVIVGSAVVGCGGDTVNQPTTVTVSSSNSDTASGTAVTLSATVASEKSTKMGGIVTFYDGSTLIGTATANSGGVASLSISNLGVGIHAITAAYVSTGHAQDSKSAVFEQAIAGTTTVSVTGTSGTATQTVSLNVALK